MNNTEIENELEKWYQSNKNNRNRWNNNPIGAKIKKIVSSFDNWKGAARGIPPSNAIHINKLKSLGEIPYKEKKPKKVKIIKENEEIPKFAPPENNKLDKSKQFLNNFLTNNPMKVEEINNPPVEDNNENW